MFQGQGYHPEHLIGKGWGISRGTIAGRYGCDKDKEKIDPAEKRCHLPQRHNLVPNSQKSSLSFVVRSDASSPRSAPNTSNNKSRHSSGCFYCDRICCRNTNAFRDALLNTRRDSHKEHGHNRLNKHTYTGKRELYGHERRNAAVSSSSFFDGSEDRI